MVSKADVSQGGWLRGSRFPKAGVGPLVGRGGSQVVPGLVLACWWVGWVLAWQAVGLQWSGDWCLSAGGQGQDLAGLQAVPTQW